MIVCIRRPDKAQKATTACVMKHCSGGADDRQAKWALLAVARLTRVETLGLAAGKSSAISGS